jgi:amino acid transporter
MYMVLNISCLLYYRRHRRGEYRRLLHGVVPILGILVFIPGFFAAAGLPIFDFIPRLPYPISLAGLIMGIWMVLGLVYLAYATMRAPERIRATATVLDEVPEPSPAT